jgi:hypothetical protein
VGRPGGVAGGKRLDSSSLYKSRGGIVVARALSVGGEGLDSGLGLRSVASLQWPRRRARHILLLWFFLWGTAMRPWLQPPTVLGAGVGGRERWLWGI